MKKFLKETSGLAIFGFFLAVCCFSMPFIETFIIKHSFFPCEVVMYGGGAAALMGIIALFYIRKTGLKGRWFAILAVVLGVFEFFVLGVCI